MITEVPPDCTVQRHTEIIITCPSCYIGNINNLKISSVSLYFLNVVQFKLTVWYFL